jgi:hypothetical protein
MADVPRKPRDEFPGAVHHAFARGNAQQDIFRDDRDRARYLARRYRRSGHLFQGRFGSVPPEWVDVDRLLAYSAADGGDPLRRYAEFVALR